jgi:hypothetical protein
MCCTLYCTAMVKEWGIFYFVRKFTRYNMTLCGACSAYAVRILCCILYTAMVKGWGIFYFVRKFTRYMTLCGAASAYAVRILCCILYTAMVKGWGIFCFVRTFTRYMTLCGAVHNTNKDFSTIYNYVGILPRYNKGEEFISLWGIYKVHAMHGAVHNSNTGQVRIHT